MSLKELLKVLAEIARQHNFNTPYIVGGIPRNLALGRLESMNDIDITTGSEEVHKLADLFAAKVGVRPKIFDDGHRNVRVGDFSIDFSSHATYDNIDDLLNRKGVNPSNIARDAYSRDFTVNTLLVPLDFSGIVDPTGQGSEDVKNKVLNCPVSCDIALKESPNRIIRAFYYAAKYGFTLSDELKRAIKSNLHLLKEVKDKYASDKLSDALKLDSNILDDLIELGVMHKVPFTKNLANELIKQKRLHEVL